MSAIGRALSVLNRMAGSTWVDRMGLKQPVEAIAYRAARDGLAVGAAASRRFKAIRRMTASDAAPAAALHGSDAFDLNISDEQQMIKDSAQRLARESLRPAAMEADASRVASAELKAKMAELGLSHYAVPESLGGAGGALSPVTSVIVAEALAHGDMGLALNALASIGVVNALVRWGSTTQKETYLPAFLEADAPAASLVLLEPQPLFEPSQLATRARANGAGYILRGAKSLVPLAESAELFLVAAELEQKGPQIFVVERSASGVTIAPEPAMGIRAAELGRVQLDDVHVATDALLGGEAGACNYRDLVDLGRIAWCALATGTAQAVLEYVIEYCNERIAFGEPISHRQAVAFMIADIAIEVEGMRLLMLRAASRAEHGLKFHDAAYLARVFTAGKAMEIGTNGVQLLGGHGFIKEHPVERWYRDLRAVGIMEGALLA